MLQRIDQRVRGWRRAALAVFVCMAAYASTSYAVDSIVRVNTTFLGALTVNGATTIGTLTLANGETLDTAVDATFRMGRNNAGTVLLTSADNDATAGLTVLPGGAAALGLGGASTTAVNVLTDGTGTAEVALPAGSIDGTEILDDTVTLTTDTNGNYIATVTTSAVTGLTGGAAGSEGTAITLGWDYTATLAADPALGAGVCVPATTGFVCEGATANLSEGLMTYADMSADRTWTFPDRSGTVVLSGDTFTSDVTGTIAAGGATALTVAPDAVALTVDTTGIYVASVATSATTGLTGGMAGSEGPAITLGWDYTATLAADPALAASVCVPATTGFICEGLTANGFESLMTYADPTADRTYTFPDRSGTVVLSGDTFTSDVTGTIAAGGATALTVAADAVALATDTTGSFVRSVTTAATTGLTGGAVAAEDVAITLGLDYSATLAADPALGAGVCVMGTTGLICEGATANTFEDLITFTDPTADRTFTHPDGSGTYDLIDLVQTFTAAKTTNSSFTFATLAGDNVIFTDATGRVQIPDAGNLVFANASGTAAWTLAGATGNGTLAGDLTISGNDLIMADNTAGKILVASGTTYVPIAMSSDATLASTGALTIAANAVTAAKITDITRSINLPLSAWNYCGSADRASGAGLNFANTADAFPDLARGSGGATQFSTALQWDVTGGSPDTQDVCITLDVPPDYVSGGVVRLKFLDTATNDHTYVARTLRQIPGSAEDTTAATPTLGNGTGGTTTTTTCDGSGTAGAVYICTFTVETIAAEDGLTFSIARSASTEALTMLGAEFRYTATE